METNEPALGKRLKTIKALLEVASKLEAMITEEPVITGRITAGSADWRMPANPLSDT